MTRFDAAATAERRSLVVDVIEAHRERGSIFCTVEADTPPDGQVDEGALAEEAAEEADDDAADDEEPDAPAWIQFSDAESQLNLDCTDEEYDRITDVLGTASAFTIDEQASPEDADGRNLRVTTYADAERIAAVVDRIFVDGFDYDEDYRLWATEI
ncbi:hypothetical protein [Salinarchaeum laminariae]|uniref:hypothetical protein n=1 Tax=Salinarchaeum laminariae TaxID=869888 RepID=UPI0020BE171A|nr:hypothetical protein [Salinarchaeum laminariae]